jgi:hypothetical protein
MMCGLVAAFVGVDKAGSLPPDGAGSVSGQSAIDVEDVARDE